MRTARKLILNNKLAYLSIGALVFWFLLAFLLALVPELPSFPSSPDRWQWFVSSWNLAGPIMFIVVFRIHTLRELHNIIQRQKPTVGVTPWVRFWFGAAIVFGLATLLSVLWAHFGSQSAPTSLHASVLTIVPIIAWALLVYLSISLFRMREKCSKSMLNPLKKARPIHNWLLVPSSLVFFIFTGLHSFVILVT